MTEKRQQILTIVTTNNNQLELLPETNTLIGLGAVLQVTTSLMKSLHAD